jgi:hypothetical protein
MNCPTRLDRHFAIPSAKAAVDGFTVSLSEIRVSQEISQNEKIPTINSQSTTLTNISQSAKSQKPKSSSRSPTARFYPQIELLPEPSFDGVPFTSSLTAITFAPLPLPLPLPDFH